MIICILGFKAFFSSPMDGSAHLEESLIPTFDTPFLIETILVFCIFVIHRKFVKPIDRLNLRLMADNFDTPKIISLK